MGCFNVFRSENKNLPDEVFDLNNVRDQKNNQFLFLQISWVRRKESDEFQLLTVGRQTYSGDERYTLEFQYPGNWRLQIKFVSKKDEGLYECQISTHPPKVIQIFLYINGKSPAEILGSGIRRKSLS